MEPKEIENYKTLLEKEAQEENVPILRKEERERFLSLLKETAPKRILEIGTAIGYSALLMGEGMSEAEIDTVEIEIYRQRRAQSVMEELGLANRIHCHLGDATKVIPTLEGPYDFVYLDGPKGQYLKHLQLIEPLLSDGAVIVADNVLFRGLVEDDTHPPHRYRTLVLRLREYLAYVKEHYDTTLYPEGDGLAVSRKKKDMAPLS